MDQSLDFVVTDFSSDREKKIIHYIINHPECSWNKVIVYCSENGGPHKKTVEKTIAKLIEDGVITERDDPNDKRSFMLTVESENLLEILPKDLESIFSKLMAFARVIKEMIENDYSVGNEPPANHISAIVTHDAKKALPFLPYYTTSIINSLYTFYFIFVLPTKIENRDLISKLHSWYFENLSKIYSFYLSEFRNTRYYSSDLKVLVKSRIDMGYSEHIGSGLYSVSNIVRICRINGIEEQLYEVLDQLWIRNEETSSLLYALDEYESKIEQIVDKMKDANELHKSLYKDRPKNNNTLNRIHRQI
ncbi:MAG TPA: hypothetical protein VFT71_02985, partial [Candidatus Nitrosocosmicus sp.]|nr:hypothetical protein [Candidatus Nitrosocosmicus sp.]